MSVQPALRSVGDLFRASVTTGHYKPHLRCRFTLLLYKQAHGSLFMYTDVRFVCTEEITVPYVLLSMPTVVCTDANDSSLGRTRKVSQCVKDLRAAKDVLR